MNVVCNGACLQCPFSMGNVPSDLTVLPSSRVQASAQPIATVMDHIPLVNIKSFGMCMSPANPAVQAIIASSLGTIQYAPCIPATILPWMVGKPQVLTGAFPTLDFSSKAMCMWGGLISVTMPGQTTVLV
ncbi:MAG: DUF4280 domain-containing protein [Alphaproteobacteria bacterium]|nr:MAG: DUF4280 domain-containing protein [Alphaproteobacteria bacterium]